MPFSCSGQRVEILRWMRRRLVFPEVTGNADGFDCVMPSAALDCELFPPPCVLEVVLLCHSGLLLQAGVLVRCWQYFLMV